MQFIIFIYLYHTVINTDSIVTNIDCIVNNTEIPIFIVGRPVWVGKDAFSMP